MDATRGSLPTTRLRLRRTIASLAGIEGCRSDSPKYRKFEGRLRFNCKLTATLMSGKRIGRRWRGEGESRSVEETSLGGSRSLVRSEADRNNPMLLVRARQFKKYAWTYHLNHWSCYEGIQALQMEGHAARLWLPSTSRPANLTCVAKRTSMKAVAIALLSPSVLPTLLNVCAHAIAFDDLVVTIRRGPHPNYGSVPVVTAKVKIFAMRRCLRGLKIQERIGDSTGK